MPVTQAEHCRNNPLAATLGPAVNQPALRRSQRILQRTINTVKPAPAPQPVLPPPPQLLRRSKRLQKWEPSPPPLPVPPWAQAPVRPPTPLQQTQPWLPTRTPYVPRIGLVRNSLEEYEQLLPLLIHQEYQQSVIYALETNILSTELANLTNFTNREEYPFQPMDHGQPTVEEGYLWDII